MHLVLEFCRGLQRPINTTALLINTVAPAYLGPFE